MINDPLWGKIKCVDAEKLQELLKEIKPMDLVPVTRCKDCKHYEMASNEANGLCEVTEYPFVPWDFCSIGERKEE